MANVEEKVDLDAPDATFSQRLANFLRRWGVETHGIAPIPKEQRTDPRSYQLFLLWFSSNMNIANLVVGATGPVVFNLSLKDTAINLLITNALSCIIPAYLALVQARFSWGVYGVAIPSLLNVVSMVGFLFLNVIIGGQLLAGVSHRLTPNVGIVIIALVSLVVSFCGYKFLHWFESLAWIPTVVGIAVMLGAGGKHLASAPPYPTPSVASTLSFAATVAASDLTWCTVSPDYGVYHDASGPRIFTYTYLGIFVPSLLLHVVGAAFAAAAPGVPSWKAGYNGGNDLGGLVSAVLEPCGWFGKFLVAVMALAIAAPSAPTLYSFGISLMNVHSVFAKVPRYVFAIIGTVICIPLGVVGQTRFYSVLVTALDVMGYWCASYAGIVFIEHIVFRRRDFAKYKLEDWDRASKLPLGLAALLSFFGSLALVVPFMAQTWYTGPIAKAGTGDIGLLVGFFSSCILYGALRPFEIRWFPSHSS